MKSFFSDHAYRRKHGERMASWVTRWEEGLDKLRKDEINVDSLGDLSGWWFLEMDANLSEERIEMVKTHMGDSSVYDRTKLREVVMKLFPNLHTHEGRRLTNQLRLPSSWRNRPSSSQNRGGPTAGKYTWSKMIRVSWIMKNTTLVILPRQKRNNLRSGTSRKSQGER